MKNTITIPNASKKELEEIAETLRGLPVGNVIVTNNPHDIWYCEMTKGEESQ